MPYVQTEYWKAIVKHTSDEMIDLAIRQTEESISGLKEIAVHGDSDSPIYKTIEIAEADLALYKEEKKRRLEKK